MRLFDRIFRGNNETTFNLIVKFSSIQISPDQHQLGLLFTEPFGMFESRALADKVKNMPSGTLFEPENPFSAKNAVRQRLQELLELKNRKRAVAAKGNRAKSISLQVAEDATLIESERLNEIARIGDLFGNKI